MASDLFLIAPRDADSTNFADVLASVLETTYVAALMLPKGSRSDAEYKAFAKAIIPVGQKFDCAVLLDNDFALARELGADGVHMSTGIANFKEAISALKPDMIVGAGAIHSRHDAMAKAEAGADYIFFDNDNPEMASSAREQAVWWSETFEIPCVTEVTDRKDIADCPGEFMALGNLAWTDPDGAAAIVTLAAANLSEPDE